VIRRLYHQRRMADLKVLVIGGAGREHAPGVEPMRSRRAAERLSSRPGKPATRPSPRRSRNVRHCDLRELRRVPRSGERSILTVVRPGSGARRRRGRQLFSPASAGPAHLRPESRRAPSSRARKAFSQGFMQRTRFPTRGAYYIFADRGRRRTRPFPRRSYAAIVPVKARRPRACKGVVVRREPADRGARRDRVHAGARRRPGQPRRHREFTRRLRKRGSCPCCDGLASLRRARRQFRDHKAARRTATRGPEHRRHGPRTRRAAGGDPERFPRAASMDEYRPADDRRHGRRGRGRSARSLLPGLNESTADGTRRNRVEFQTAVSPTRERRWRP